MAYDEYRELRIGSIPKTIGGSKITKEYNWDEVEDILFDGDISKLHHDHVYRFQESNQEIMFFITSDNKLMTHKYIITAGAGMEEFCESRWRLLVDLVTQGMYFDEVFTSKILLL